MKSNNKMLLPLLLLLLAANSCKKEFLERTPLGNLTYDTFFETPAQALEATNAVYNQFRSWECLGLGYIGLTDIISDDADKGSTENDQPLAKDIDEFVLSPSNVYFSLVWTGYYRSIARANVAIKRLPDVDMDPALRARLIGECKFLRAYSYLLLVQWFGDLPVITQPLTEDEYYSQRRQPASEVYAQIERDLLDAIEVLPKRSEYAAKDLGRATKGAAQGILAKLYMVKKDFPNAEKYCLEIINSGQYSLLDKYGDNFLPSGENSVESIFEIQAAAYPAAIVGPGATPFNMIQGVRGVPNLGWGFNRPSDNLKTKAYEHPADPRLKATIIEAGDLLPDQQTVVQDNPEIFQERYNRKAWVPNHPGLQDNGPGNIRILRYADVLLLAAEALNENGKLSEALNYINLVRQRARKGLVIPILQDLKMADMDQSKLRERIYKERRVELAMEQHRWFDLVRWGRASSTMTAVGKTNFVPGKHELMPIPQTEIDLTAGQILQNNGYN